MQTVTVSDPSDFQYNILQISYTDFTEPHWDWDNNGCYSNLCNQSLESEPGKGTADPDAGISSNGSTSGISSVNATTIVPTPSYHDPEFCYDPFPTAIWSCVLGEILLNLIPLCNDREFAHLIVDILFQADLCSGVRFCPECDQFCRAYNQLWLVLIAWWRSGPIPSMVSPTYLYNPHAHKLPRTWASWLFHQFVYVVFNIYFWYPYSMDFSATFFPTIIIFIPSPHEHPIDYT